MASVCTELDVGLKKDALLSSDGSSLEALLKGDSLEKRPPADPRASEEDSNPGDFAVGLNPAARIRKVLRHTSAHTHVMLRKRREFAQNLCAQGQSPNWIVHLLRLLK